MTELSSPEQSLCRSIIRIAIRDGQATLSADGWSSQCEWSLFRAWAAYSGVRLPTEAGADAACVITDPDSAFEIALAWAPAPISPARTIIRRPASREAQSQCEKRLSLRAAIWGPTDPLGLRKEMITILAPSNAKEDESGGD